MGCLRQLAHSFQNPTQIPSSSPTDLMVIQQWSSTDLLVIQYKLNGDKIIIWHWRNINLIVIQHWYDTGLTILRYTPSLPTFSYSINELILSKLLFLSRSDAKHGVVVACPSLIRYWSCIVSLNSNLAPQTWCYTTGQDTRLRVTHCSPE